jgi:tRNA pseudouridine32 synthase / 23S rRNA pseudouridine746 synthase
VYQPLSDFNVAVAARDANDCNCEVYYYEGRCPQTGEMLRLPRTILAEAIARSLMQSLTTDNRYSREGKMYGILLVETPSGEQGILKAFSGLLNGCSVVEGWVPPIPGREEVALEEAQTLAQLDAIKQELITLQQLTERQQYETLSREFELCWQAMSLRHQNCKQQRDEKRQVFCETLTEEALTIALEQLNQESRLDGIERRQFKRQRDEVLQPIKQLIEAADTQMRELKQRRKELSRQLQTQMHAAYTVMNFWRKSLSLQQLMPGGLPTGTGDCCAPKLLHYAATENLKPLAMAEFWWGSSCANGDKIQGEFYGACAERCQPLMGFLLSGLCRNDAAPLVTRLEPGNADLEAPASREIGRQESPTLHFQAEPGNETPRGFRPSIVPTETCSLGADPDIIYHDKWLIIVNKPAGLLSVPGRYFNTQDSVLSRLRHLLPDGMALTAAHRLDRETSGILLLARDLQTYRQLSQQFQKRQVRKVYEAVLSGTVTTDSGVIELPLWKNPENRPLSQVNWQYGKPSVTRFQVIATEANYTRVEFIPLTGRTHQLRVHAADARGLGIPILGDSLYGCSAVASRLHLHARELCFEHPQSGESLYIQVETPF